MADPKEDKNENNQNTTKHPGNDIETVTSDNDNIEPVPDKEQLEEKKEAEE
ncbi:hypothetical protein BDE36_2837 [Arcticibacter tournemirensis]|uniref:hypothetical protein n=1 Tax=Arcticibacter tournemirensis TaxID=699437 RepID=UPI00116F0922|nr:hypothetical protein [Arcticibacter tournemirensis]TQM51069.1 hypothetical protein BDE36_2837 [Arcticibacter tournemirensis]